MSKNRSTWVIFGALALFLTHTGAAQASIGDNADRRIEARQSIQKPEQHRTVKRTTVKRSKTKVASHATRGDTSPKAGSSSAAAARGMVTVPTAAGISITVRPDMVRKFQGLIGDMVAQGYNPKKIHCFATHGHVNNSRHYAGGGCDFDQTGWNKTAPAMYRMAALSRKWGLRDGCTFRDCGHIDDGHSVRVARKKEPPNLYVAVDRFKTAHLQGRAESR